MNKYLLIGLLFFAPVSLACADLKIAVIDLSKTFDAYNKTKDASTHLEEKAAGYKKEIQDMMADFEHMQGDAKKLYDASIDPTLSEAARADKKKALDAKNQDLMSLQSKIKEMDTERGNELRDEQFRRHKEIVDDIVKVINDYSGPQGFDLVIDKSSVSASSGAGLVLYSSSKLIDITTDVIAKLNAAGPATSGAAPSGSAPAPVAH